MRNSRIQAAAKRLAEVRCESFVRDQRLKGFPYPQVIREWDERKIAQQVYADLKASGQYSSVALWWFYFTVLLDIVRLVIRERNKRNGNVDNTGGS